MSPECLLTGNTRDQNEDVGFSSAERLSHEQSLIFGELFGYYRYLHKKSQTVLAKELGMDQASVSFVENGRHAILPSNVSELFTSSMGIKRSQLSKITADAFETRQKIEEKIGHRIILEPLNVGKAERRLTYEPRSRYQEPMYSRSFTMHPHQRVDLWGDTTLRMKTPTGTFIFRKFNPSAIQIRQLDAIENVFDVLSALGMHAEAPYHFLRQAQGESFKNLPSFSGHRV